MPRNSRRCPRGRRPRDPSSRSPFWSADSLVRATIDIGIDLGTSNSTIARYEGGRTRLLGGPDGAVLVPSIVHISAAGTVVVGEAARHHRDRDPDNAAAEFKR